MNLVEEFQLRATLKPPLPIGEGPQGTRLYFDLESGEITGERLRGKLLGGGEWALQGPDGFIRVDVRLQVETHDGAYLYMQYTGLLEANEAVQGALANGPFAVSLKDELYSGTAGFITWEVPGVISLGTDTFVVEDELIVLQTNAIAMA